MSEQILELKKLTAAYRAALEFDYCPDDERIEEVQYSVDLDFISEEHLKEALFEHQGCKPDEIANQICVAIINLKS